MKQSLSLIILICLLSLTSCIAPKMAQTLNDVKKLEINEQQFIGKSLKVLLKQVKPKIILAIGNPEGFEGLQSTYLIFYFVDKQTFITRDSKGDKPLRISVLLKKKSGKNYPPLLASKLWSKEQLRAYGEMKVLRIWVNGKD